MTDPTLARLDALGNENRALRAKCDALVEKVHDRQVDVVRLTGVAEQAMGGVRDLKRVNEVMRARIGVLEEAKAKSAGIRIAATILGSAGASAGYNAVGGTHGMAELLSSLF